eukprot:TRINITY_DN183_c0_g1_i3.p1 TRINITY_DN183_c0_g1~~TRINITY_DN183_c0_g1_i3.p1  ORF type:complete len:882 (+),score=44.54 TRINITY_DN183_c0_g1_i3:646-3291(+)
MNKFRAVLLWTLLCFWHVSCAGGEDIVKSYSKLNGLIQETVWCGEDNRVVLLRTLKNTVYRSEDRGETFRKITKHMVKSAEKVVVDSDEIGEVTHIMKSEADSKTLVFVGDKGVFWVSNNCGGKMKALSKEFLIAQIRMHPTEPNWILATTVQDCKDEDDDECFHGTHSLYLTKDLGATWREVAKNVKQFDWVFGAEQIARGIPSTRIFVIVKTPKQDVLYKSDNFFGNKTALVNNCLEFKVRSQYLVAVQRTKGDQVSLFVSSIDNNLDKFYKAIFPDVRLKPRCLHVLDSSEGVIFVLVTRKATDPYGRLYVSDSTGLRYSLSLRYCLRNSWKGADFMKVQGLEGIYMANVIEKEAVREYERMIEKKDTEEGEWDNEEKQNRRRTARPIPKQSKNPLSVISNGVRTLITFNKGGAWKYLMPPKTSVKKKSIHCKGDEECSLNLFLYEGTTVPAYSQYYAHGIILATGNIGGNRLHEGFARNVYLSRDGGLTWLEIAKGPHVYDMADHGGLIIMSRLYSNNQHKVSILYSWNEGSSWQKIKLTTKNATIEDIFTEPDSITQHFLVHTVEVREEEDGSNRMHSTVYSLNFEQLHQRACLGEDKPGQPESDFELWSPYDGRHGQECLLGRKISYVRRKRDSECYNGVKFESPVSVENCECTEEDYECDFGFIRKDLNSNSPCTAAINISYAPPSHCPAGSTYTVTSGYRKVAGDTCKGGVRHDPIIIPCPASSLMSGSGLIILVLLLVIVVLLLGIGYTYQNFEDIRKRLQTTFKSSGGSRRKDEYQFKDVKYGKIEEKQPDEPEEEVIIQPSAVVAESQPSVKAGEDIEMNQQPLCHLFHTFIQSYYSMIAFAHSLILMDLIQTHQNAINSKRYVYLSRLS